MRPKVKYFVNRERELELLSLMITRGDKILIKGRRGIGKSVLALKVLEEVEGQGFKGVYINCSTVTRGSDLLRQMAEELCLKDVDVGRLDNKTALENFFREVSERGVNVIVLDEFTNLFRTLGRKREFGNVTNFAAVLRGCIMDCGAAVIATSSSLAEIRKIIRKARILARTFDFILNLGPLDFNNSLGLISLMEREYGWKIPDDVKDRIVILADFVPFYVECLTKAYALYGDLDEALRMEFTEGTLAEYFFSLYEDLNPTERLVIYNLAIGRKKYEDLESTIGESDLPQMLSDLIERDLISKVFISRKNVFYVAKDRTFASWVLFTTTPQMAKDIELFKRVSTIGFEALVRETLGALGKQIRVKDALGRELVLGPFKYVGMGKSRYGQIDVLAIDFEGRTLLGECYFGTDVPKRKIEQLEKHLDEYPHSRLVIFHKGGVSSEAAEILKEKRIYLVDLKVLGNIRKNTPLHPF